MKPVLNKSKRAAICAILAVGGTRSLAARHVGCSRQTITNTANRDPDFRHELEKAESSTEYDFLTIIRAAANEGPKYWQAAKWALQHMYPDRYNRRPFTMALDDVKDLISQLLAAIVRVIPDSSTRAAVRLEVRTIAGRALRKAKESRRAK